MLVPTYQPTPTKLMVLERLAQEASGYAVDAEFARPAAERLLLAGVAADTTDEAAVRAELAEMIHQILARPVASDSADVDDYYALWSSVNATSDPVNAWKVALSALLQDPEILFY